MRGWRIGAAATTLLVLASAGEAREKTPFGVSLPSAGFERIAYSHGVSVYRHKHSRLIRLAAEGRFSAPPDEVQRLLRSYTRQVGKIGRLSEARILERRPHFLVVYQRLNLPVISDRDFTLKVRWGKRGYVRWVSYRAIPKGPAHRSGVVRVTRHEGSWQLKPIKGTNSTWARFQVVIDLGGWLPLWLARSGSGKEVPQVFVEFDRMLSADRARALSRRKICTSKCS